MAWGAHRFVVAGWVNWRSATPIRDEGRRSFHDTTINQGSACHGVGFAQDNSAPAAGAGLSHPVCRDSCPVGGFLDAQGKTRPAPPIPEQPVYGRPASLSGRLIGTRAVMSRRRIRLAIEAALTCFSRSHKLIMVYLTFCRAGHGSPGSLEIKVRQQSFRKAVTAK